jgi:hypothetical protein
MHAKHFKYEEKLKQKNFEKQNEKYKTKQKKEETKKTFLAWKEKRKLYVKKRR